MPRWATTRAQRGIEQLWTVGELCVHAASAYGAGARHFDSVDAMLAALGQAAAVQSALVKGSKFMRMPRVVQALLQESRPCCLA